MLDFIRTRSRTQLVACGAVLVMVVVTTALSLTHTRTHPGHPFASAAPTSSDPSPPLSTLPSPAPTASSPRPVAIFALPRTASADVYAAALAQTLLAVDYTREDRDGLMEFLQRQLAGTLPVGTAPGTTVAQAQDAAMSTIAEYVASPSMWATLAQDHTVANFHVTSVSEPASWVSSVTSGKIADPGLTARTVVGVQTIDYGQGSTHRSTKQSQAVTMVVLCPPTTSSCSLEILPPRDVAGSTG